MEENVRAQNRREGFLHLCFQRVYQFFGRQGLFSEPGGTDVLTAAAADAGVQIHEGFPGEPGHIVCAG